MIAAALGFVATAGCDDSSSGGSHGSGGSGGDMGPGDAGGSGGEGGGGDDAGPGGADAGSMCNAGSDDACPAGQYCAVASPDDLFGTCTVGCRQSPDSCTNGQMCNDQHQCVTPPCQNDGDCPMGKYCDVASGMCMDGCREDDCSPGQLCVEHVCVATVACCAADNTCSMTAADACAGHALMHATSCEPNPCGAPCPNGDADCGAGQYCTADGVCGDGCRAGDTSTCPTDQVCDPDKHTCEDHPCDTDADCPDTFYCDTDGAGATNNCHTGCRIDPNNCDGGQTCVVLNGGRICTTICDPNDATSCPEGQYCAQDTMACRDQCDHHDDCLVGEVCDFSTSECVVGSCRDDEDGSEPNDDNDHATNIDLMMVGAVKTGQVMGHVICEGNPDIYRIHLDFGERARIDLNFMQGDGNLDLHLFTTDGNEVASAATLLTPERIEYPDLGANNVPGADYFLHVENSGGVNPNGVPYSLRITVVGGGEGEVACFPDDADLDPNVNDNNRRVAHLIGQQMLVDSTDAYVGSVCGVGDEDWFRFPMHQGDGLRAEVTATAGSGDLVLEMWAASTLDAGGGVATPNVGPNQPDMTLRPTVDHHADGTTVYSWGVDAANGAFHGEDWFLRVRGANPTDVGDYALQVHFHRGAIMCDAEASEPNNSADAAFDLGQVMGLTGADGFLTPDRDLDVPLMVGICPAFDEDFYCFNAQDQDQLQAWITSQTFLGDATIEFVNPQGQQRGQPGNLAGAHASVVQVGDGSMCIRVDGVDAGQGAYQLHLRRHHPMGACGVDVAETGMNAMRNDSASAATPLMPVADGVSSYDFNNGFLCNVNDNTPDNDWYSFQVAGDGDSRVCVTVDFDQPQGDVDVQMFRDLGQGTACASDATCQQPDGDGHIPGGSCVAGRCQPAINESTTDTAPEMLSRLKSDGTPPGPYWVRVFSGARAENAYNLSVSVVGNEACTPDGHEGGMGNDDINHATYLGGGSHKLCDAWICQNGPDNGDFYAIDVLPGEEYTAHIAFQDFVDGPLWFEVQGEDPANGGQIHRLARSGLQNFNYQCINIRGGMMPHRVYLRVLPLGTFIDDGEPMGSQRIDYALSVVPTDLAMDPAGKCITLSGGVDPQQEGWPATVDLP